MADEPAAVMPGSVGMLYHRSLDTEILVNRASLGHVEIMADHFLCGTPETWEPLARLKKFLPVVAHGVGLSLGSAAGLDRGYADKLCRFLDFLKPEWFGEHIAFVQSGGRQIENFAPLPRCAESLAVLHHNVASIRAELPCPLILENVAAYFDMPGGEFDEPDFLRRVADATGCGLLIDLHNLHVNAVNLGYDACRALERMPLEHAREVHIAGGLASGRFLVDTHTRAVPEEVFELLERLADLGARPAVTLEWDAEFPSFQDMLAPIERARKILDAAPARRIPRQAVSPAPAEKSPAGELSILQDGFLACVGAAGPFAGVPDDALSQFRRSLAKKRARRRSR